MKSIVISVTVVMMFIIAVLVFREYEQHQHVNLVLKEEQKLRQELCDMEPSKRKQFCQEFTKQIDESTVTCFALNSGLDGDEHPVSTSVDWSEDESSDTTSSYLHCQ
jgi:uncharacterized protein YxeA